MELAARLINELYLNLNVFMHYCFKLCLHLKKRWNKKLRRGRKFKRQVHGIIRCLVSVLKLEVVSTNLDLKSCSTVYCNL